MRIAVIGSGIAGLASAWCLQQRHDVTLIEAEPRLGGHTHTVDVDVDGRRLAIDTGFIVCNARNYPNLLAMLEALDVPLQPTSMSFSVSLGDGRWEWHGSDRLWPVFAQPRNLLDPRHWRFLSDILRGNARCRALLASGTPVRGSLSELLATLECGAWFAQRYLLPMAGLIWSCSPREAADYPAADFLRFFDSHGLFSVSEQPQWYSVVGGSRRYVDALAAQLRRPPQLGRPVRGIRRGAAGVAVQLDDGTRDFDAVVSAVHADDALQLLSDARDDERAVLGGIPYTRSEVVLHRDTRLMPRRRAAWAAWNYRHQDDAIHDRPVCGSYWMNRLQRLDDPRPWLVTLNPDRDIDPACTHFSTHYRHPHYRASALDTHRGLPAIQGRGGLWWCGAWAGYGFHEDGLRSALSVVASLDARCLPGWARDVRPARPAAHAAVMAPATATAAA